jgi:SAM-dependent methyltransferase
MNDEVEAAWNAIAKRWAALQGEHGDANQRLIINPALFALAGEVRELRVLDAACGSGHVAREFARRGAQVTGLDLSARMIQIAADSPGPRGIEYRVGDISRIDGIADGSFDMVVCSMALMNVANLEGAIGEFARVLRPGGRLVFSIPHPCYPRKPGSHGVCHADSEDRLDYYRITDYLSESDHPVSLPDEHDAFHPVPTFHRTLSTYVALLVRSGLVVDGLAEPMPPDSADARAELGEWWWDATRRIPYYLVMRARRE